MSPELSIDPSQIRKVRHSFSPQPEGKIGRLTFDRRLATERRDIAQEQGATDPYADRHIKRINNLIVTIHSNTQD